MPDSLTLTPVGVGAAYARPGEAQSAYLVAVDDTSICLDLGAGALNRLQELIAPERLAAVVVSHLHPDHCIDLLSLRVYMEWGPGRGHRIRVIGPPGLRQRLTGFSGDAGWEGLRFEELGASEGALDVGPLRLTWVEVPHTKPTFALRVDHTSGSITYSADCGPNDGLARLASETDVLVAECGVGVGPSGEGAIHLSAVDAATIARRARARSLLLTHCPPEHDRGAVLAAAARVFDGPVAWALQGQEVVVSTS